MDIYLQDRGPQGANALRAGTVDPVDVQDPGFPSPKTFLIACYGTTSLFSVAICFLLGDFKAGWIVVAAAAIIAFFLPRSLHKQSASQSVECPLAVCEVNSLRTDGMDPLRGAYLDLVIASIRTDRSGDIEAERSVREAILGLGSSIAGLAPPSVGTKEDAAALLAQAAKLSAESVAETDAVVAASLRRRVEAIRRQADTVAQTNVLLRRNDALLQEVAVQIAALQTNLHALQIGSAQAVMDLAGVAASIQQVAQEAGSLTEARTEIGTILSEAQMTQKAEIHMNGG